MNHSATIYALLLACFINPASAADDHKGHAHNGKPGAVHAHEATARYGGVVSVIKDINYELVAKPDSLTLYVTDHEQPVDVRNASATLTLLSAADKAEVQLLPAGDKFLRAVGTFKVQAGTKAVALVKFGSKPAQQVRFVLN
ncbi:hypothetical protein AB6Q56_14720 [Dechloromonas sp. ARDL1]|uniref:hypothetical protein n=1 Tax=Dechloromonas sp. ARDL1 TaxID=3322121 RepID=UPI003DA76ECC